MKEIQATTKTEDQLLRIRSLERMKAERMKYRRYLYLSYAAVAASLAIGIVGRKEPLLADLVIGVIGYVVITYAANRVLKPISQNIKSLEG